MPGKLEVSFNSPQCGWMSIGFEDGSAEFHTTTAHSPHKTALSDLMRILTDLAQADARDSKYTLQWNRDPEEFDFVFMRHDGDLKIEIYQYPSDERAVGERELAYSHTGPAEEVIEAFARTFDQLYADRDTDEFEFNWRQPFPTSAYQEFKEKISSAKA
jgi:hypothetical protein